MGRTNMKIREKKATSCSFLDPPPEKTQPLLFLATPPKKENPFFRQLIKINQYNYNCTSSMYSVPVQKKIVLKEKIVLQHIHCG